MSEKGTLVTSPLKEVIDAHPTEVDDTSAGPVRATVLKSVFEHVQLLLGAILSSGQKNRSPRCER